MYGALSNIAIAFIATALLVVMVDQMTRIIKERYCLFPQSGESVITYICGIASVVCWQGDFDLFRYLNFQPGNTQRKVGFNRNAYSRGK